MTADFYAAGATPAALANLETTVATEPFNSISGRIPSLAPNKERDLAGMVTRSGKITAKLACSAMLDTERIALNTLLFGDQVTASAELYLSALGEDGFFSPYLAIVERAYESEDYQLVIGGAYVRDVMVNLFNCRLQVATKTSNYTVTTSDRYLKADTSGGSVTFALPALASAGSSDVVYSFHKTSASNSMVLDGNGTETIDGALTKTLTANGARIDIAKIGGVWQTVKSGSMI